MGNNLKFNSQICTTKIQSERLLALGLKKETADMALQKNHFGDWLPSTITECPFDDWIFPAWSLHRLIEIYDKTCIFWSDSFDNPYEAMISRIAYKIKCGELNKEYLEE